MTRKLPGSSRKNSVVDYRGACHRIDRAGLKPLPGRRIPIWFGGFSPGAFRRAARPDHRHLALRPPADHRFASAGAANRDEVLDKRPVWNGKDFFRAKAEEQAAR